MRPVETYEVFAARTGHDHPLQHIGSVRASESKSAAAFAYMMYDEWRWQAMFVVSRAAIIFVKKAK
ncbi:MAG: hypothetical protein ACRDIB_02305 [Ardenticatenaceae bacterium]